jgi:hypothetical protein
VKVAVAPRHRVAEGVVMATDGVWGAEVETVMVLEVAAVGEAQLALLVSTQVTTSLLLRLDAV